MIGMKRGKAGSGRQGGFTLVELMISIAIIGILAALGMNAYSRQVFAASLESATPFLMSIAAKERIYFNERGVYYTSATNAEQDLEDTLGVNLKDASDFCLMVVNDDSASGYLSTGNPANIDFEVWAVLRDSSYSGGTSNGDDVNVDGIATSCTTAGEKNTGSGQYTDVEGRVVVLRYPPPNDGQEGGGAERNGRAGVVLDWTNGISFSDPQL